MMTSLTRQKWWHARNYLVNRSWYDGHTQHCVHNYFYRKHCKFISILSQRLWTPRCATWSTCGIWLPSLHQSANVSYLLSSPSMRATEGLLYWDWLMYWQFGFATAVLLVEECGASKDRAPTFVPILKPILDQVSEHLASVVCGEVTIKSEHSPSTQDELNHSLAEQLAIELHICTWPAELLPKLLWFKGAQDRSRWRFPNCVGPRRGRRQGETESFSFCGVVTQVLHVWGNQPISDPSCAAQGRLLKVVLLAGVCASTNAGAWKMQIERLWGACASIQYQLSWYLCVYLDWKWKEKARDHNPHRDQQ